MIDFVDGMDFGLGFNSLKYTPMESGITSNPTQIIRPAVAQTVFLSLQRVTSIEDLQNALDIGISTFPALNVPPRFNFAESLRFNGYSVYSVVKVTVENQSNMIHNVKLNTTATNLVQNGRIDEFYQQFGDSFIEGIKSGGQYYAVLEFQTHSEEEKSQVEALSISFLPFDGITTFSDSLKKIEPPVNLQIHSFQLGGKDQNQPVRIDDIIQKATRFPQDVVNSSVPVKASLRDYMTIDIHAGKADIDNRRQVLQQYYRLRNSLVNKLNDIEYILQHTEEFENPDQSNLPAIQQNISRVLDSIKESASMCADYARDCKFGTFEIPSIILPKRK